SDSRWMVLADARHLLPKFFVFGSGFGTFDTSFLPYQSGTVELDFSDAHNDYLQLATEAGVLGFVAFVGLMLTLFGRAAGSATAPDDWRRRALALGCAGALAAIGVHSFFDFNMQIPANALLLSWIAGMAASLAPTPQVGRRRLGRFELAGAVVALL